MTYTIVNTAPIVYDIRAQANNGKYFFSYNDIPYLVNKRFKLGEAITAVLMRDIVEIMNGFINKEQYAIKEWKIPKIVTYADMPIEEWPELKLKLIVTLFFCPEKGFKWIIRVMSDFFNKTYAIYGIVTSLYLEFDIYQFILQDVFYLLSILNIRQE